MHRTRLDTDMNPPETTAPPTPADTAYGYRRRTECQALDRLVADVQADQSRVLVIRGDAGVGKTVLLDYLAERASNAGCRVARMVGVRAEMGLAFAGLHQLFAPMLGRAEQLPGPQRDALRHASGLGTGPPPDGFLVGMAMLSLVAGVAGERPLICVRGRSRQWLTRPRYRRWVLWHAASPLPRSGWCSQPASRARELAGLPELPIGGLRDGDARALLTSALAGPLDARVRDLIVAESHGNPLALLELPRGLSPAELAGGFGLPAAVPLDDRIMDSCRRHLDALPDQTRRLVQVAAADPSGDRSLVWRAAGRLGIPVQAAAPAAEAGLVEFGTRVHFRSQLSRAAAYRSASHHDRRTIHAALAEVTDSITAPDRRAWHRAQAVTGPDEEVAAELSGRPGGRGPAAGWPRRRRSWSDRCC